MAISSGARGETGCYIGAGSGTGGAGRGGMGTSGSGSVGGNGSGADAGGSIGGNGSLGVLMSVAYPMDPTPNQAMLATS